MGGRIGTPHATCAVKSGQPQGQPGGRGGQTLTTTNYQEQTFSVLQHTHSYIRIHSHARPGLPWSTMFPAPWCALRPIFSFWKSFYFAHPVLSGSVDPIALGRPFDVSVCACAQECINFLFHIKPCLSSTLSGQLPPGYSSNTRTPWPRRTRTPARLGFTYHSRSSCQRGRYSQTCTGESVSTSKRMHPRRTPAFPTSSACMRCLSKLDI